MKRQQPRQARKPRPKHPRFFPAPIPILGLTSRRSQKNQTLSFHALTRNPFCIPFVFKFMHGMGGCTPPPPKKEQLMNTTTVSSSSIPDPIAVPPKTATSRCTYLYPNAKRCSLPGLPVHSGFCLRHSQATAPTAIPVPVSYDSQVVSA